MVPYLQLACVRQKAAGNKQDIAALKISLSSLVTLVQGPLMNSDQCPPALHERIMRLSRSLYCHCFLCSPVVSNRNDSTIDEINGTLEGLKQEDMLRRVLRADDVEAEVKKCVQRLQQHIDTFVVCDYTVVSYYRNYSLFCR